MLLCMQVIVTTVNKIQQVLQALSGVVNEDTTTLLVTFAPIGEPKLRSLTPGLRNWGMQVGPLGTLISLRLAG